MSPTNIVIAEVLIAIMAWFMARKEAAQDNADIRANKPIHHGELLFWRITGSLVFWGACMLVFRLSWSGVPMLLISYGVFSYCFRTRLNYLRGLPRHYTSESNVYDRVALKLTDDTYRAGRLLSRIEIASALVGIAAPFLIHYLNTAS